MGDKLAWLKAQKMQRKIELLTWAYYIIQLEPPASSVALTSALKMKDDLAMCGVYDRRRWPRKFGEKAPTKRHAMMEHVPEGNSAAKVKERVGRAITKFTTKNGVRDGY